MPTWRRAGSSRTIGWRESRLLLKRSRLEEKLGKYSQALRWAARAHKAVDGIAGADAALHGARATAWYATVLQAEGKNTTAIRWAQRAVAEAEPLDDPDALGAGYFVMGWAYAALGKPGWEPLVERSLAAYQRSGDRVKQAVILSNVGVVCQGEGRWDEAMDYYERGRDASLKIGDVVGAAVAHLNVAEILIDRGELTEAETLLRDALPQWRASKYRYFLGACLSLLGRAALRAGRAEAALGFLEEAKAHFTHVGAEQDALAIDARIAECHVLQGDAAHRAGTRRAHARAREFRQQRGDGGAVARTGARRGAAAARRPRRRRAGTRREPGGGPRAQRPLRGDADVAGAGTTRAAGGRCAPARSRERKREPARHAQGAGPARGVGASVLTARRAGTSHAERAGTARTTPASPRRYADGPPRSAPGTAPR